MWNCAKLRVLAVSVLSVDFTWKGTVFTIKYRAFQLFFSHNPILWFRVFSLASNEMQHALLSSNQCWWTIYHHSHGKSSMGHGFHGYVRHNQMVFFFQTFGGHVWWWFRGSVWPGPGFHDQTERTTPSEQLGWWLFHGKSQSKMDDHTWGISLFQETSR